MEGDEALVEYFICPISLQIMKDPVTTATGITYDRQSIERWLSSCPVDAVAICPVTKQPIPRHSHLTPNHNLSRLIRATGKLRQPLTRPNITELLKDPRIENLRKLESLAAENGRNRKVMTEEGVAKAMARFIIMCHEKAQLWGLQEALSVLSLLRISSTEAKAILTTNSQILDALSWVLERHNMNEACRSLLAIKWIVKAANHTQLGRLDAEFFQRVLGFLRCNGNSTNNNNKTMKTSHHQGIIAVLHILLDASMLGRNRAIAVGAGAVSALIELEFDVKRAHEKRSTELILGVLFQLCRCADGRAQLVSHPAGIALVAKRILRVSPGADDRAVGILTLICRFTGKPAVIREMVVVGAVAKLCMVAGAQEGVAYYLKNKAREILRSYAGVWKASSCVSYSLLEESTKS